MSLVLGNCYLLGRPPRKKNGSGASLASLGEDSSTGSVGSTSGSGSQQNRTQAQLALRNPSPGPDSSSKDNSSSSSNSKVGGGTGTPGSSRTADSPSGEDFFKTFGI